jgi:hypothetical protein
MDQEKVKEAGGFSITVVLAQNVRARHAVPLRSFEYSC